jgi:23S rRNA (uracil1939-C5)-methyltransferase
MNKNEIYKSSIYDQENTGLGVSKINDIITFVENGLPGEIGEVLITEVKKNYARGKMISFETTSKERGKAPCPYYDECGGCDLQHQQYNYQLKFKESKVKNALEHIGGFKNIKVNNIIFDESFNYRNKITLKVFKDKLGFYKRNTNEIIDINYCMISNDEINKCLKVLQEFIKMYKDNLFKSIMIRYGNGLMIDIDSDNDNLKNELKAYLPNKIDNLKSLILNNNILYGNNYIEKQIGDYIFKLSSKSFYQVNNKVMKKLYDKVIEHVSSIDNKVIIDLYCGIGTITSLLSKYAKRVIGIEVVSDAIKNAKNNAIENRLNNVIFEEGKVEDLITNLLNEEIDTIVMDPPRSGVEKSALDTIIKIKPKQIIYVSCDPVTLARDLKILCEKDYEIKDIAPFDMFPQTFHVESVVLLQKEDNL